MTPLKSTLSTRLYRVLFFVCMAVITVGCVHTPQSDQLLAGATADLTASRELVTVPFFPQRKYQCGPAALATALGAAGVEVTADDLVAKVYVPERRGSFQVEMQTAARQFDRIPYTIKPELQYLLREIQGGRPVLVLQNLGISWIPRWHYSVVVGFDLESGELVLRSGTDKRRITPLGVFENTWRRSGYWGIVLLKPGELPSVPDEKPYFTSVAAYATRAETHKVDSAYQAGIEKWPGSVLLRMGLANFYYEQGELENAARLYQKLITTDADYAPAHNNLAQVLFELGNKEKAIYHAQKAVELGGRYNQTYQATLDKINRQN